MLCYVLYHFVVALAWKVEAVLLASHSSSLMIRGDLIGNVVLSVSFLCVNCLFVFGPFLQRRRKEGGGFPTDRTDNACLHWADLTIDLIHVSRCIFCVLKLPGALSFVSSFIFLAHI